MRLLGFSAQASLYKSEIHYITIRSAVTTSRYREGEELLRLDASLFGSPEIIRSRDAEVLRGLAQRKSCWRGATYHEYTCIHR